MKFRNIKKFRYGIPAYTNPFQALVPAIVQDVWQNGNFLENVS
jgi:hypothetical protein